MHLYNKNQTNEGINYDNGSFNKQDEFVEYVLKTWNSKIINADTVYISGNLTFGGRNEKLIELVAKLKGKKIWLKRIIMIYQIIVMQSYLMKNVIIKIDGFDRNNYYLVFTHYLILFWNGLMFELYIG